MFRRALARKRSKERLQEFVTRMARECNKPGMPPTMSVEKIDQLKKEALA
jgi:hypothetical protein